MLGARDVSAVWAMRGAYVVCGYVCARVAVHAWDEQLRLDLGLCATYGVPGLSLGTVHRRHFFIIIIFKTKLILFKLFFINLKTYLI